MASMTYPVKTLEGTLTPEQIHLLLQNPNVIARRIATLADQRFVADYLLPGRYDARGGGIYYETGEELFPKSSVSQIAPGSEYPLTIIEQGDMAAARVVKWGLGTKITDEKIAREGRVYLDRALNRLVNGTVRDVDAVAMAVITSKVTSTAAAPAEWESAGAIADTLLSVQDARSEGGTGIELSTVVLKGDQYAQMVGMLIDVKALPRESGDIILKNRQPFDALGVTWVTTPHWKSDDPLFVDRDNLGGMADEHLGSPGWTSAGEHGVEANVSREDEVDGYLARARRVTVAVVTDPSAGVLLTGTGLRK